MKKIIVFLLLLLVNHIAFGQKKPSGGIISTHDNLERSAWQSKVTTILLVSGIAFVGSSFIIPEVELVNDCEFPFEGYLCY